MITLHEQLVGLRADGAESYPDAEFEAELDDLDRLIRRQRAVRTAATSVVAATVAVALIVAAPQFAGTGTGATASGTPSPATASDVVPLANGVSVAKGERVEDIAGSLAGVFGVTRPVAYQALADALPKEAHGNPEGWIGVGDYAFDDTHNLAAAARSLVSTQVIYLASLGVSHDDWLTTVILASIVEQEAPAAADQPAVVRVLLNRLDAGIPLAVRSVYDYSANGIYAVRYSSVWPEAQYNLFERTGLPPSAIGASTREALAAAAYPAKGDWLYFLTGGDGTVHLFADRQAYGRGLIAYYRPPASS